MAYDYSTEYLTRHADLVANLIKIAGSGELLKLESDNFNAIRIRQYTVNNCLASIERNMPEFANIRSIIRCWTKFEGEKYHLYVGQPSHKLPGKVGSKSNAWVEQYNPRMGNEHRHAEPVVDPDSLTRFVGAVMSMPKGTTTVTVEVADLNEQALEFFKDLFEHHNWAVSAAGSVLTLKRTS